MEDVGQHWWLVYGRRGWMCCRCTGGGRAASVFAWGEFDAVGVELLLGSGQIVGSGFQRSKGGTFGCGGGMCLELLSKKSDERA